MRNKMVRKSRNKFESIRNTTITKYMEDYWNRLLWYATNVFASLANISNLSWFASELCFLCIERHTHQRSVRRIRLTWLANLKSSPKESINEKNSDIFGIFGKKCFIRKQMANILWRSIFLPGGIYQSSGFTVLKSFSVSSFSV